MWEKDTLLTDTICQQLALIVQKLLRWFVVPVGTVLPSVPLYSLRLKVRTDERMTK